MRLPLPIAAFLVVIALWAGWTWGQRSSADRVAGRQIGTESVADQALQQTAADDASASVTTEADLTRASESSDQDRVTNDPEDHRRAWLGVLAVTALGLMVVMLTSGGVIPPRMDHTIADVLHTLPQGVCILDDSGKILMANIAAARLTGWTPSELLGRNVSSLAWLANREHRHGDPWHLAASSPLPVPTQWMRMQCKDGPVRTLAVNATTCAHPPDPRTFRTVSTRPNIVLTLQDVTEVERRADDREKMVAVLRQDGDKVRRHNRRLQELASTDPLTGCLNRRRFFACFEKIWRNRAIRRNGVTVLMIDNDRFKQLNDTHGHAIGDEVLRRVSSWLLKALPEPALVCRYGGEEFCVLMPTCQHDTAMEVAEMLRQGVQEIRLDEIPDLRITVSIGVATAEGRNDDVIKTPVQLIAQADRRLYEAKNNGRNRVEGEPKSDDGSAVPGVSTLQRITNESDHQNDPTDLPKSKATPPLQPPPSEPPPQ